MTASVEAAPLAPPAAPRSLRMAAAVLQAGALVVALAMLRRPELDYDAFAVPKELAFSLTVWVAALLCLPELRRAQRAREGLPLLAILLATLGLGLLSVVAAAVNRWCGWRALGLSATTVAAFWCARQLAQRALGQQIVNAGVILVAAVSLGIALESMGALPILSLQGRAPGGFAGNRNFAAHVVVIGLPLLVQQALVARSRARRWLMGALIALAVATLCFTRCRAAWLALLLLLAFLLFAAGWRRLRRIIAGPAAGVVVLGLAAGLALGSVPARALSWARHDAFGSTLPRLLEYQRGTGRGRLIQYRSTLRMLVAHPWLGVGPGNWSLRYPEFATGADPSIDLDSPQPVPRLPNSDWLGFAAERGLPAFMLVLLAFLGVARGGVKRLVRAARAGDGAGCLRAWALLATLAILLVLGALDAVLQRSEPALLAALLVGAWAARAPDDAPARRALATPVAPAWWARALWTVGGAAVVSPLALRFVASFWLFAPSLETRRRALEIDRGNFVAATSLAVATARLGDCDQAFELAERARRLNPFSPAVHMLQRHCPPRPIAALTATARSSQEVSAATQALLSEPPIPVNISPAGDRLLVQRQDASGYSLLLVDRASGGSIATIQTRGRPRLTAWSPDGRKIAYATDEGGAAYQLWIWDLESRKLLRPRVPTTRIVTQPRWAASSRFLTHVVEHKGTARALFRVEARDGAVPVPVADAITPKAGIAWAPAEAAIATVRAESAHTVTIIATAGTEKTIALEEGSEIRDLAYASDGRKLLLTVRRKRDETFRLAVADPASGKVRFMPPPPAAGDVVAPFFLPDGHGIVYRVHAGDEKLVFTCDQDALACRRMAPEAGRVIPWGVSPDGKSLFLGQLEPKGLQVVDVVTGHGTSIFALPPPEGVGPEGGRINVPSFDGLEIPVHLRRGRPIAGGASRLFVQVLGAIGRESPAPWDTKAEYLYQRGITVLKIYVRGKAGFGRKLQDAPGGNAERVKDIRAVLDYAIRVLKVPPDRIVLFGHSDGALLAAKAAAAGAPIGGLVVSSMVRDPDPAPPVVHRCAVAFQGAQDALAPEVARAEVEKVLGPGATREPCGRFQAIAGEAHELERAESWAEVFAAVVIALDGGAPEPGLALVNQPGRGDN